MLDIHFVPEGQEDMVKVDILNNSKMTIIFFIYKTLEVSYNVLHIRHQRNSWSLRISQGNLLHFQYMPKKRQLHCNEGILDKTVGWPIERNSVAQMFRELEGKAKSKSAKVTTNTFKWIKKSTKEYLKEIDIDINEISMHGKSLLHAAAKVNDPFYLLSIISKFDDVNQIDKIFVTPLHEACRAGCLENAKILLNRGASVNALTANGNTPLMLLAHRSNPDLGLAKLLLRHNAQCDIENNDGMRAVDIARQVCKNNPLIPIIHPLYSQL